MSVQLELANLAIGTLEATTLAAAIALATGVVFGLSNHLQHLGLDHMDVRTGTLVNVATTAVLVWLASPLFLVPSSLLTEPIAWFALAGLVVPSMSMMLHSLGVRVLGPGLTAGLASTSPVFAMTIATIALGEVVTPQIALGTALVIASIGFIALRSRKTGVSWPLWAIAIPLGAALLRAVSHNAIKIGLTDLPSPLTATLVCATTSLLVLGLYQVASRRALPTWNPGYLWFGLTGVLNGLGLLGLNVALALGDVVVVAPLIATTPAFTLVLGWLFFRRELVQWTSVTAIVTIFLGCILIISR